MKPPRFVAWLHFWFASAIIGPFIFVVVFTLLKTAQNWPETELDFGILLIMTVSYIFVFFCSLPLTTVWVFTVATLFSGNPKDFEVPAIGAAGVFSALYGGLWGTLLHPVLAETIIAALLSGVVSAKILIRSARDPGGFNDTSDWIRQLCKGL